MVDVAPSRSIPTDLLERGVRAVLEAEGVDAGEISVALVDDATIREMNLRFLDRDRTTDVIAFPLYEEGEPVLGDVYLGLDQAERQARERRIPVDEELLRLAIHGTLHVLGHDHPEGPDREGTAMYRLQEALVDQVLSEREEERE